jgi:hypothetical protein
MPTENERLATLEAKVCQHEKLINDMCGDIKDIKDNLLKRPSWAVVVIITLLSTVCTGLIVFVATKV